MTQWFSLLIQSQGRRLYWGVLWVLVTALSGVSLLMLSGWFITATALTGIALSAGLLVIFDMYLPGSGIRFFALSRTIGRYTERVYNHDTVLRLIATFRTSIFKHLMTMPMRQLRATADSEWLGKLTADLDALDSILLRYTITPIAGALAIIIICIFLSFIWFQLALYLGGFLLLLYISSMGLTILNTAKLARSSSQLLSDSRAALIAHVDGAFELKSYQLMQRHEQHIRKRLQALSDVQTRLNSRIANIQWMLDSILGLALASLVFVALYAVKYDELDGPVAILLVMMFLGVTEILQTVPSQFGSWGKTQFAANRLTQLVEPTHIAQDHSLKNIASVSVKLNTQANIPVTLTQTLSFSVTSHKMLIVVGRSGTGKSSLAGILSGLDPLDGVNSCVMINDNIPLQNVCAQDWYARIGYLEQNNSILAGSLGYNLALGLDSVPTEKLWSVLTLVELEQWAEQLPEGLNTWLGETGGRVSGGQARRICFARLLLREPQLVILDEPFNGIDEQMSQRIWNNISVWLQQRNVILLSHEIPNFIDQRNNAEVVNLNVSISVA